VDEENIIIHAEKMSGWTNFAGLKPVPALVGLSLDQILDETSELPIPQKLATAFRNAANDLRTARIEKLNDTGTQFEVDAGPNDSGVENKIEKEEVVG